MTGAKLRLCLAQVPCVVGDVQANLRTMVQKVEALKGQADIVVFPELFTSGYGFPLADADKLVETQDGPSFQLMSKCARENETAILYSFPEKDESTGSRYISLMFIDQKGAKLACCRKTHLWDPFMSFERAVFVDGDRLCPIVTFPCEGGVVSIGLLVCWDLEHPEPARVLAFNGANVILVCGANSDLNTLEVVVRARALEDLCHVAYCNMTGGPFCGHSLVAAPTGDVLGMLDNEVGHVIAVVEPDNPTYVTKRKRNPFRRDRQAELYTPLVQG
eukprot:comp19924_c0_seq1/m.24186 comp19924_c0_seq1/g.24186  ORF comp19924_c0_seq1/g.24186 comp19924_c0_seq1/m.24186 type:complete len:275 (-) comp19924_c0_seq1:465-1289(-)